MDSSANREPLTIFAAALVVTGSILGLVTLMVTSTIDTQDSSYAKSDDTNSKSLQLDLFVNASVANESQTARFANASNSKSATSEGTIAEKKPFFFVSGDRQRRVSTGIRSAPNSRLLTEVELQNTLRDLFRISSKQPPVMTSSDASDSEAELVKARVQQVRSILNDPTLQGQSSLWKFLYARSNSDQNSLPSVDAARRLSVFLPRAFRRPIQEAELKIFLDQFDDEFQNTKSFQQSMKAVVETALSSKEFLSLQPPTAKNQSEQYFTASRISYLLWGTMPDDELLMAAREGRLVEANAIRDEVSRMLADRRAKGFAQRFGAAWLGQPSLNDDQLALLHEAFSKNRSIMDLIDSTEDQDSLTTLAKTQKPTAGWMLRVLLNAQDAGTVMDENAAQQYLSSWLGIPAENVDRIRKVLLEDRAAYTSALVSHMLAHATRARPIEQDHAIIEQISKSVAFNQYRAHNLIEEVVVQWTIGAATQRSNSRMTSDDRMRR